MNNDRRGRVLGNILAMSLLAGAMPIGFGVPGARLDRDDYGPPLPRSKESTRALHQPARSPAEVARRKKRKAARKSRKGRK